MTLTFDTDVKTQTLFLTSKISDTEYVIHFSKAINTVLFN